MNRLILWLSVLIAVAVLIAKPQAAEYAPSFRSPVSSSSQSITSARIELPTIIPQPTNNPAEQSAAPIMM